MELHLYGKQMIACCILSRLAVKHHWLTLPLPSLGWGEKWESEVFEVR